MSNNKDDIREYARQLVLQLNEQILNGCGDPRCTNPECASSRDPSSPRVADNEAFVRALELVRMPNPEQWLCANYNSGAVLDTSPEALMQAMASGEPLVVTADVMLGDVLSPLVGPASGLEADMHGSDDGHDEPGSSSSSSSDADNAGAAAGTTDSSGLISRQRLMRKAGIKKEQLSMTLDSVREALAACESVGSFDEFIRVVREVFGSTALLGCAFVVPGTDNADPDVCGLDLDAVVSAYEAMYWTSEPRVGTAVRQASEYLMAEMAVSAPGLTSHTQLRQFVILLLNPCLLDGQASNLVRQLAIAVAGLPSVLQSVLVTWLSRFPTKHLSSIVATLQSFIVVRALTTLPTINLHRDIPVVSVVQVLGLAARANDERRARMRAAGITGVVALDHEAAPLPEADFYNDALNSPQWLDLVRDYENWISDRGEFTFCRYPFVFDAATKADVVFLESELQMQQEGRRAMIQSMLAAGPVSPYLVLRVRRDNIIEDTLNQLARTPNDFKKEMKVKFVGEDGVDEGGVRKEFFQVIVRELFDANFGMFTRDDETGTYFFNPGSLEDEREFQLCGIILGLAIYNKVILDLPFAPVVYNRLCGVTPTLADLASAKPDVARNLAYLRNEFDGDFADLALYFDYEYDHFGEVVHVELVPGGSSIPVTLDSLDDYIAAYVRFVLVDSVATQFSAFAEGFYMVVGKPSDPHTAISLFSPAELELLICGSEELDFHELEDVTRYDGYEPSSPTVQAFWEVVHDLDLEHKKKLLFFSTGSDRVPIKGLKALNFVIVRHGGDSDRLPTSHTCFNTLMLPDYGYANKDKLHRLLITAITNSEGFGML